MTSRRAFTLIEVLVALSILATSMFALVLIRNRQFDRLQRTMDRLQARELAMERIARIVSDARAEQTLATDSERIGNQFLVRSTKVQAWLERVPMNMVTVDVYRLESLDRPLDSYTVYLSERPPSVEAKEAGEQGAAE